MGGQGQEERCIANAPYGKVERYMAPWKPLRRLTELEQTARGIAQLYKAGPPPRGAQDAWARMAWMRGLLDRLSEAAEESAG